MSNLKLLWKLRSLKERVVFLPNAVHNYLAWFQSAAVIRMEEEEFGWWENDRKKWEGEKK